MTNRSIQAAVAADDEQRVVRAWFPDGVPDDDNEILSAWAGISLKICVKAIGYDPERIPAGELEDIADVIDFMGIGWDELENGANLAVKTAVDHLKGLLPGVPDNVLP